MDIWYYLMLPFSAMLKLFYSLFNNYGVAIILFSLAIKIILFPFSLKGKKGMIQMNMLAGQQQKLQKQYGKDQQRYQEELQKLYDKEGVNPMGGCLWSFLPIFILFPVYAVVRRPLKYWLGITDTVIGNITLAVADLLGETMNKTYPEISIMSAFFKNNSILNAAQTAAPEATLYGLNFNFLGIDLAGKPELQFWVNGLSWNSIGLFLIPIICAATALLSSQIMMKTNEINAQASQQNQQNKMMMWMSPVMMLWFGFIMPGVMGVYIISNSVFSVAQDLIMGKMLKKDYEAAAEARRLQEIEEKEEEKRLRREKAEQKAREAEEARKNKAKQKKESEDGVTPEMREASRVGIRQYARGRSYDPNRYGGVTPYHDDPAAKLPEATDESTED